MALLLSLGTLTLDSLDGGLNNLDAALHRVHYHQHRLMIDLPHLNFFSLALENRLFDNFVIRPKPFPSVDQLVQSLLPLLVSNFYSCLCDFFQLSNQIDHLLNAFVDTLTLQFVKLVADLFLHVIHLPDALDIRNFETDAVAASHLNSI